MVLFLCFNFTPQAESHQRFLDFVKNLNLNSATYVPHVSVVIYIFYKKKLFPLNLVRFAQKKGTGLISKEERELKFENCEVLQ